MFVIFALWFWAKMTSYYVLCVYLLLHEEMISWFVQKKGKINNNSIRHYCWTERVHFPFRTRTKPAYICGSLHFVCESKHIWINSFRHCFCCHLSWSFSSDTFTCRSIHMYFDMNEWGGVHGIWRNNGSALSIRFKCYYVPYAFYCHPQHQYGNI